jgi:hypothetical protein
VKRKILGVSIIIMLLSASFVRAQENDYDYTTETIWGINKNTASGLIGGFVFRFSRAIRPGYFKTYGFEIMNVRHPAESRVVSRTGNSFIIGKINHLYTIRLQYGRTYTLFKKASQQGVQVDLVGAVGPSIGLESPYYIEYNQNIREPYDPAKHRVEEITGRGYLLQGLFQSNIVLGLNVKAAVSVEFGSFKSSVSGFEIGFLVDSYYRKIEMIPEANNYAIWPTAFITLFYGSRK